MSTVFSTRLFDAYLLFWQLILGEFAIVGRVAKGFSEVSHVVVEDLGILLSTMMGLFFVGLQIV